MKKIALAAALSVASTSAFAGGMAPVAPVMEPAVVVEESSAGSAGIVIPLLLLAVVAAVAVSD